MLLKALREHGADYFFNRQERRGQCYKMTAEKLSSIQGDLDSGLSIYRTALNNDMSESAINYHIKHGKLKKEHEVAPVAATTPKDRALGYLKASEGLGMAASRVEERLMCTFGQLESAPVVFESCT